MNIADATHIVYPTHPVEMRVDLFMGTRTCWTGRLTMKQVTSIRDALESHVWCLPPGRLYVNGVCVCEFGRGLVTCEPEAESEWEDDPQEWDVNDDDDDDEEGDNQPETVQ